MSPTHLAIEPLCTPPYPVRRNSHLSQATAAAAPVRLPPQRCHRRLSLSLPQSNRAAIKVHTTAAPISSLSLSRRFVMGNGKAHECSNLSTRVRFRLEYLDLLILHRGGTIGTPERVSREWLIVLKIVYNIVLNGVYNIVLVNVKLV
ncbi:hypothetical protein BUALT_Bualt02G0116600 [Buddleja alternifolia]|uniref:Uncharacterized protein n=1 Tax=Buddleja alternifolia TaxID=168488 RepID=A0AAV6YAI4_9LAMI|nr:hypothetical protein BUALT_Bualt02G0116600 [Buddleja alternifolia]